MIIGFLILLLIILTDDLVLKIFMTTRMFGVQLTLISLVDEIFKNPIRSIVKLLTGNFK